MFHELRPEEVLCHSRMLLQLEAWLEKMPTCIITEVKEPLTACFAQMTPWASDSMNRRSDRLQFELCCLVLLGIFLLSLSILTNNYKE